MCKSVGGIRNLNSKWNAYVVCGTKCLQAYWRVIHFFDRCTVLVIPRVGILFLFSLVLDWKEDEGIG